LLVKEAFSAVALHCGYYEYGNLESDGGYYSFYEENRSNPGIVKRGFLTLIKDNPNQQLITPYHTNGMSVYIDGAQGGENVRWMATCYLD
jgi:hypothetical protein